MSEWSDLPNAQHIDWVISSVKTHPQEWAAYRVTTRGTALDADLYAAWDMAWDATQQAAQDASRDTARDAAWDAALDAASGAGRGVAWHTTQRAARDAIAALVAYDHASKYFGMPSDQVRLWATLSEEPAAILMLPAVVLRERIEQVEAV